MSWSKRNLLRAGMGGLTLLASGALLAACGWKPLYGQASTTPSGNATVDAHLAAIKVKAPVWERSPSPYGAGGRAKYDARVAQILHNALRDGLNPYGQPSAPSYDLGIELSEAIAGTLTADGGNTLREDLDLRATFLLSDAKGNELLKEKTRSIIAYAVFQDPYQDLVARNDARERTARQLAEQIKLRLSGYFATHG